MATESKTSERSQLAARLRLVVTRLNRRLRTHADSGLSASAMAALATIGRRGPLPLGELAALEGVRPPTMSVTVAALDAEGLVRREPDPVDRRVARAALTAKGKVRLQQSRTRKTAYLAAQLEALEPDELRVLERAAAILERLLDGAA
jgi:DNA-binding MarR family transcriptional regulator